MGTAPAPFHGRLGVSLRGHSEVSVSRGYGAGRFEKIGIPAPQLTGPFVGVVETVCGTLLIFGLFTTFAVLPLLIDIMVAITTTKGPLLLKQGFWAAMHEARTDFCMIVGLVAALLGAGAISWMRGGGVLSDDLPEPRNALRLDLAGHQDGTSRTHLQQGGAIGVDLRSMAGRGQDNGTWVNLPASLLQHCVREAVKSAC